MPGTISKVIIAAPDVQGWMGKVALRTTPKKASRESLIPDRRRLLQLPQPEARLERLTIPSAESKRRPGLELNIVFPVFIEFQAPHQVQIDDRRAVNPAKCPGTQLLLEICHA